MSQGFKLDASTFLVTTIHERVTKARVEAFRLLDKYPELCDHSETQEIVDLATLGHVPSAADEAEIDRIFDRVRQLRGAPPRAQLRTLSLVEAKAAQRTGQIPDGSHITLPAARSCGVALLCDLHVLAGGRTIDSQNALKGDNFQTKSLTCNVGLAGISPYIAIGVAADLLERAVLFFSDTVLPLRTTSNS